MTESEHPDGSENRVIPHKELPLQIRPTNTGNIVVLPGVN